MFAAGLGARVDKTSLDYAIVSNDGVVADKAGDGSSRTNSNTIIDTSTVFDHAFIAYLTIFAHKAMVVDPQPATRLGTATHDGMAEYSRLAPDLRAGGGAFYKILGQPFRVLKAEPANDTIWADKSWATKLDTRINHRALMTKEIRIHAVTPSVALCICLESNGECLEPWVHNGQCRAAYRLAPQCQHQK